MIPLLIFTALHLRIVISEPSTHNVALYHLSLLKVIRIFPAKILWPFLSDNMNKWNSLRLAFMSYN